MRTYIARRLLLAVPTLLGVTALIFVAMRVIPGDPLKTIFFEGGGARVLSEEEYQGARASLGLDKPLYVQYVKWLVDVAKLDMGSSFWTQKPIREIVQRRGTITLEYAILAVAISWVVGLPVGLIAAVWRNSLIDYVVRVVITLFMAIPSFWLGLSIVLAWVLIWQWRPPMGIVHLWDDPFKNFQIIIGPAVVIGVGMGAVLARMARATLLEVLGEDYVRTARAKGLVERLVVVRHALRNALLPVLTLSGLQLAAVMGGSVAVESAFSVPGLGMTLVMGIQERDWVIIQNVVLIYGVLFVFVNLAVDLAYAFVDPRIRYQ
jgi:peptide/nickel transport system permease protein